MSEAFALRPYQVDAIQKCRAAFRDGGKRVVLLLPTGGGKTCVATEVVRGALEKGSPVVWLAHRRELVDQACRTLEGSGLRVGAIAASSIYPVRDDARVQVASIQTLLARKTRPFAGERPLLVWDEAHHCAEVASYWNSLLEAYPDSPLLGLTATPERGDGHGLAPLFDTLVVGATIAQLTAMGFLVPCVTLRPALKLGPRCIAQDPVDAYLEHGAGRQGFIFSRTVEEAHAYAARLTSLGIRSAAIDAGTRADVRRASIEGFRTGAIRLLCNVFVFTEGTDLPAAAVCFMARGCGTPGQMLQMVGRVLRPAPGKTEALFWDGAGVSHKHGEPAENRIWSLHGKACTTTAATVCARCGAVLGPTCAACGESTDAYPCGACAHWPDWYREWMRFANGEYPCSSCGYAPDGEVKQDTVITGDRMLSVSIRCDDAEDKRWTAALFLAQVCVKNGFKAGWLRHKYLDLYGKEPPDGWCFKALRLARGDRKVGA